MSGGELLPDNRPPLSLSALDDLIGLHLKARLNLRSTNGLDSTAHIAGDAEGLVLALLHAARVGLIAQEASKAEPTLPVRMVVTDALRRWRLELGFA